MPPKRKADEAPAGEPAGKDICSLSDEERRARIQAELKELAAVIRSGSGSEADLLKAKQKLRQLLRVLSAKMTRDDISAYVVLVLGNDPNESGDKIIHAPSCRKSLRDFLKRVAELTDEEAAAVLDGWATDDVSSVKPYNGDTLRREASALLRRLAEAAQDAQEGEEGCDTELRVLATGKLMELLVQLKLKSSRMFNPASTRRVASGFFCDGAAYCACPGSESCGRTGQGAGVQHTVNSSGISARTHPISSQGLNLRRVRVRERGAEVATFLLAVCGHAGGKKRGATEGDIEVPAQLLRDLFDGKTLAEDLTLDLDAL